MTTSVDVQYIGDIMSTSGDVQYIGFSIEIERLLSTFSPTCIMISLRCTHDIPPMYWTSLDVLMVHMHHDIPQCSEHPLMYSWYPPHASWYHRCTERPRCTHDIPPMYSWYPPDVLNIPRCAEYTLYRVVTYFHKEHRFHTTILYLYQFRYLPICHAFWLVYFTHIHKEPRFHSTVVCLY